MKRYIANFKVREAKAVKAAYAGLDGTIILLLSILIVSEYHISGIVLICCCVMLFSFYPIGGVILPSCVISWFLKFHSLNFALICNPEVRFVNFQKFEGSLCWRNIGTWTWEAGLHKIYVRIYLAWKLTFV